MNRIQWHVAPGGAVAAVSPDGKRIAFVTWRGDLPRNTNVYSLTVKDAGDAPRPGPGEVVLTRDFAGDPDDQTASPFEQVSFLGDNRSLAYIGRDGASTQVFTVDIRTHRVRQLTHSAAPVRSYFVDAAGRLRFYSAEDADRTADQAIDGDGVFLWDSALFPQRFSFFSSGPLLLDHGVHRTRQYYLPAGAAGGRDRLVFDSKQSRPDKPLDLTDPKVASAPTSSLMDERILEGLGSLTGDPKGRYVLMFPYAVTAHPMHPERYAYYGKDDTNDFDRRVAAPYGLIDLASGRIERLIDAPHPVFERYENGDPIWLPDGKSIVLYTLSAEAPADPPQWVEVDLATRRTTPLHLPKETRPIAWSEATQTLTVTGKNGRLGALHRRAQGQWDGYAEQGTVRGFNGDWPMACYAGACIGVYDTLTQAPELAACRPGSGEPLRVLTDLNPQLKALALGEVTPLHWDDEDDGEASGFLVKPVGYQQGKRYPLVVMLDDGTLGRAGEPFIFDGVWQLSGHAAQMLAARGFMVLYTRERHLHGTFETAEEGIRVRHHIESGIDALDAQGLIDPARVGVSGWSRAGYHTDYLLIHSKVRFAAATTVDGGGSEYDDRMRPFTDEELRNIRTPLLFEDHGLPSLVYLGALADRMMALGLPAETLYFAAASHSTTRPQHRRRSLQTHIDWWEFWLNGQEDPDPAKAAQYRQWRQLREMERALPDRRGAEK